MPKADERRSTHKLRPKILPGRPWITFHARLLDNSVFKWRMAFRRHDLLRINPEEFLRRAGGRHIDRLGGAIADDGAVRQPIGVRQIRAVLHVIGVVRLRNEGELEIGPGQRGTQYHHRRSSHIGRIDHVIQPARVIGG